MNLMVLIALLFVLGLSLAVIEVFIPSGGMLGLLAVIAIIASVAISFLVSPWVGFGVLAAALLGLPLCIAGALTVWPHTPMGKRLLLNAPSAGDVLPDTEHLRELRALVGKIGEAKTPMLPSGAVLIDGRTINAMSDGMPIDAGQQVRVIEVRGNRVVVRLADDGSKRNSPDDTLSQPIDFIDPNPFAGPLA